MANITSIVGAAPEVSAPIRTEGQSNSEVLFGWLAVKRLLWMLEDPHLTRLESLIGTWSAVRVLHRLNMWKRSFEEGHPAIVAPEAQADIDGAFAKLTTLLKVHFFGSEEK